MRIYKMQQPVQYYKPQCRKEGEIKPVGKKVPFIIWLLLLMATFAFAEIFTVKMTITSYLSIFSGYITGVNLDGFFYATCGIVAFMELLVLYIQIAVYNFIARWYLRGDVPCSTKELFRNLAPFFVLRNLIWGTLSLLMFIPSGIFVSIGTSAFETLATMIIFFPAFYAIKKRYIKQGYGRELLQAYGIPYAIMQATFLIF